MRAISAIRILLLGHGLAAILAGGTLRGQAQENPPVVVLSPGHGQLNETGTRLESGAEYNGLVEKDINLDVARHTRDFLERCGIEVYLTRHGDDNEHTLKQVTSIVHSFNPTVAVAIHTNSDAKVVSGTEGWYTVNGFDDARSKDLAALMSKRISEQFGILDRGAKPETSNRHGGLYIHYWSVPSALVELAYLQGDYEILSENRKEFGRAVARAILEYLEVPPACADNAISQGISISAKFPDENTHHQVRVWNDGIVPWESGEYRLKNAGEPYGAADTYALPTTVMPGEEVEWDIPMQAPQAPGLYRQEWQVERGGQPVGRVIRVNLLVFPPEMKEIKEEAERRIEELEQEGEEAVEEFLQEMARRIAQWVRENYVDPYVPDVGCAPAGWLTLLLIVPSSRWAAKTRRP